MKIVESQPDEERMSLINAVADEAAALLSVNGESDSPQSIVSKIYDTTVDLVFGKQTPVSEDENPHLLLGALWGRQMERQFDWYWADVIIDDQFDEVAMIAPNQEMIIFPLSFTAAIIDRQCICTIMLAFNMLLEGTQFEEIPAGAYENIMLNIHHLIPPYTLEEPE